MEILRRLSCGELSELFGEETLKIDKYMRNVGLRRIAENNYVNLDEETRKLLDIYV